MQVLIVLAAVCVAVSQAAYGYSGPLASPVVTPNGFLADTPEVAAAKAAHFSEVSKAQSPAGYAPGPYNGAPAPATPYHHGFQSQAAPAAPAYHGYQAPAAPAYHAASQYTGANVTPQGFLADTPDVAAAKAAHFAEVAKTQTNPSYGPDSYDDGSYRPEYDNPSYNAPAQHNYNAPAPQSYNAPAYNSYSAPAAYNSYPQHSAPSHGSHYAGPLASPVVTPQGFLAETPEVAAAKAAHFAEFAKAGTPAGHGRYRRHAVLLSAPAPLHAAPIAYPYSYLHYPRSFAYSVRTW